VFGALLAITGVKLLVQRNQEMHPEDNPIVRGFQRVIPVTPELHGDKFLVSNHGRRYATPLLLALVAVEVADLVFAVDSIPAIFAVTSDPFIVFTSNIFAILGLRSLYFLLAGILTRFVYLKVGLSFVLIFVGGEDACHGSLQGPDRGVARRHRRYPGPLDPRVSDQASEADGHRVSSAGIARTLPR